MPASHDDSPRLRTGAVGVYVHDLAEGYRRILEQRGFALTVSVPSYPTMARYDPRALAQSFAELLDQATEAAGSERGAITVELRVEDGWAILSVAPEGARRTGGRLRIPLAGRTV